MMKRRYLTLTLAAMLLLGIIASPAWAAAGTRFSDIKNHWAAPQINSVCSQGIMIR